MDGFTLVLVILAFVLGCIAGAFLLAARGRGQADQLREELDDAVNRLGSATAALAAASAEKDLLASQNRALSARSADETNVLRALAPVAEKLTQVQRQVGLLERDRVEQYGQLAQQLQEARDADARLLSTTHSLAAALRSNSARGQWGEVQLRRVVEAAGMLARVDFVEQATLARAEVAEAASSGGAGSTSRPDMVVQLPGNKQLVIDAKVPLSAFLQAQELDEDGAEGAGREAERTALLQQHAKALRAHIDTLAKKKYWEGTNNSPELVICFIPVESILSSALRADPGLLDYAFSRNVALASPVSLLAILKSAAFSWRQEVLTDNARELFELSRQLYERLGTMGGHVAKLGSSLKASVEKYNSFVGTLETRVLPTARRIGAFDAASLDAVPAGAGPEKSAFSGIQAVEATPRLLGAPELLDGPEDSEVESGGRGGHGWAQGSIGISRVGTSGDGQDLLDLAAPETAESPEGPVERSA
ncbi:DNA recombination protein RmuC [Arthrobacter sp. MSA 4-2]|uniref:DNA recombination protein RmuC n=1 Tax=Arthrobacter sp. MSA 4-2 TaxID=2794349 RepID=UPI0018E7E265|nr:DNA recombination protein RmuC [Arthrobacter sp. MSA 4-2]MBJ2120633.1 DNA recombination protein RmuC [Arthrobacter sp. MSA 4-2]